MTQAQDVAADIRQLIADGRLSEDGLHALTQIDRRKLQAFIRDDTATTPEGGALSSEESSRVSILAAQLVHGLDIDDDERLAAIIESLTDDAKLTLESVSLLTNVSVKDLTTALADPGSLPEATKYRLALRSSYLINVCNQVRAR